MKYTLALLLLFSLSACYVDDYSTFDNSFVITSCNKIDKPSSGFAKIQVTVQNNSNITMGCYAYVKLKKGNTIIDNNLLVYSSLKPGESQIEEAWISKINKHSEYDFVEISLNWSIDSFAYSREYLF